MNEILLAAGAGAIFFGGRDRCCCGGRRGPSGPSSSSGLEGQLFRVDLGVVDFLDPEVSGFDRGRKDLELHAAHFDKKAERWEEKKSSGR